MPSAVTKFAVGRVGGADEDLARILSPYGFGDDQSVAPSSIEPDDRDPIWTWNAPFFLTGDEDGSEENIYVRIPLDLQEGVLKEMMDPITVPDGTVRVKEKAENLAAYFGSRADFEKMKGGRTHYRVMLSLDLPATNKQIQDLTIQFLKITFPKAIAFAAVHRDTGHTHVHIFLLSGQIDCKRIRLSYADFRSIDEKWAKIYAEFAGDEGVYARHITKKEETRQWKQSAAKLKGSGQPIPPRPKRVKGVPWKRFKD
jgi:hypothetical protein